MLVIYLIQIPISRTQSVLVMMPATAVVVAAAVAIDDGSVQEQLQDFFDLDGRGTGVDLDAQIVKQGDCSGTKAAAQDIRAALGCQEPGHRTVLMLRGLQDCGVNDLAVLDGKDADLRGLAEMGPQFSLAGGDGDFL